MNIDIMYRRSRIIAAGLCGAAVLAFTGLDAEQASAQDLPEDPRVNKTDNVRETDYSWDNSDRQEMTSRLDLRDVRFEAEVVKRLEDTALIVNADDADLLIPMTAISMNGDSTVTSDSEPDRGDGKMAAGDAELYDINPQYDYDATNDMNETAPKANADLEQGQRVQVSLDAENAELVALENDIVTVREGDSIMQLPVSRLPQELADKFRFTANIEGSEQIMTLQEAIDQKHDLVTSQGWSDKLPQGAQAGVVVVNNADKVLVGVVADNSIQLVKLPQTLNAGEAVSLHQEEDSVDIDPLDKEKTVEFRATEISGTLMSRNEDFMVIESGQDNLLLPADLEVSSDNAYESATEGSNVKVSLPAGEAEILTRLDGRMTVLETEHGVAQLPLDILKGNDQAEKQ